METRSTLLNRSMGRIKYRIHRERSLVLKYLTHKAFLVPDVDVNAATIARMDW